jgi:hypothetical protein
VKNDEQLALLRELNPLRDDDALARLASSASAAAVVREIQATPRHAARRETPRTPRWLARGALAAACAALAVALVGPFDTPPAAAGVRFHVSGQYIIARITDPYAARSNLRAAFEQEGLDIDVRLVPVSPSLVGTVIYMGESAGSGRERISALPGGRCVTGGGACPVGLRIPRHFAGHADISLGRMARTGEEYMSTASAFAPGERLHCSGLLGMPVARVRAALQARGLAVEWRRPGAPGTPSAQPPASGYLWEADPVGRKRVRAWIRAERFTQANAGGDIRDVAAYKAALNAGC